MDWGTAWSRIRYLKRLGQKDTDIEALKLAQKLLKEENEKSIFIRSDVRILALKRVIQQIKDEGRVNTH